MHADRDWFDAAAARQLATLIAAHNDAGDGLPSRVRRALWRAEHLAREHYLDIALPGLVFALEGLIGTSSRQVTRQIVTRIPALATEVGVGGVSKRLVRTMYGARSQGAHGADIDLLGASPQAEIIRKVARLQAVLRATIRRAIEDPDFRAAFADEQAIRARWPVRARHRCLRWRSTLL